MSTKLYLISALAASLTLHGAAMPTEAEVEKAVPKVERMLASEKVALESGKMTRAEVAEAAMKLAAGADDEAAKLLLMKGAFILHVKDGDLEKAVKTMNALETAIADMPPQVVTNIIETALLGLPNKAANGARLYRLLDAGSVKRKGSYQNRVQKASAPKRYFVTKEEIWRLLSSAQPRQKIAAPQSDSPEELPVFTNPAEAQRKAKELGLWMFVYNMPCSRNDTFSSSSYFLKSLSKHCVFVHVNGFGSESAECPWERSTCWPCCRILDSDGKLISPVAKWSGMPNCEVSGQKMIEIFSGFIKACEIMPAAFDVVERNPNEIGLVKLHETLSSLPESFVNIAYLKWAELLVKADRSDERGWRACYSYADKILPLQEEFYRSDDCSFNNSYWRAKRDKEKYHDFLSGIDRVVLERRISASDDIRKRISAIDEQSLSDEARDRLTYLRQEVEKSYERLSDIQRDLLALEKWPEQKENVPAIGAKPRVADGDGSEVIDGCTWSYRVNNGEATIVAEKDGKPCCAVSPKPIGHVAIPLTLGGAKVTSIGACAFDRCDKMTSVTIPLGVTKIGDWSFTWCRELMSVSIPSSVRSIANGAFFGCSGLTAVRIPGSVTSIGRAIFKRCDKLKRIDVDADNQMFTSVGAVIYTKDRTALVSAYPNDLTAVTIPKEVTRIGYCAFEGFGKLTSVMMSDGVKTIGSWAFMDCDTLPSLTMSASVANIGTKAFKDCRMLISVTMRGERPTAPNNIFEGCGKLTSIHVPANCKSWAGMTEWQGIPLVFDGELVGQVEQMQTETEKAQRDAERAEQRRQLLAIQDELKRVRGMKDSSPEVRAAVESILKGMIKVPGRDYWLSATEVTQEQWEPIMEYNLSKHKGAKLPVDMVSRDDCDVFLEKLNQTKEVQETQFAFSLPKWEEWVYAAQAGSGMADVCWIKPGVAGNVLDMAWVKENSSNQTHEVATKSPTAFGLYDMKGNVWEWLLDDSEKEMGRRRGHSFCEESEKCTLHNWITSPRNRRSGHCGLRLAAHIRPAPRPLMRPRRPFGLRSRQESQRNITLDGYTWLYSIKNGEATIETANRNRSSCAVLPKPTGNLTIPSTLGGAKVTGIGREAFKDCTELETVTIPDGVANIGDWAFRDCGKLKSLSLPSSLTNIEASAFRLCKGLTSVTIPQNVMSIGAAAFTECNGLKRIEVAAGNPRYVSIDGVLYTKDLKEVVLCPGALTSVVLPESVMSIGPCAFEACEELASVTMPECVTNIGPYSFKRCVKLTSLAIPKCVTSIGKDAFIECHGLTSLTLPEGLTRIGWAAFAHCDGLKSLTIPANVTTIEGAAFSHCTLLESMVIPAGVKSIEGWTFDCCERLSSVKIPEGVAKIGENAFKGCGALTSVTIPDGVTSIEKGAFNGCARLESVSILSNVKTIGAWAFQRCDGLTSVTLPEGVTRIEQGAFYECRNLASVNLPQGLESIAGNAFMLCQQLAPMTIPSSVTNIGGAAFAYCGQMKHIDVADENRSFTSIDGVVYTKDRTELVAFPSGKTSVTIPESVTIIRDGSFTSGSLTSVTIPPTVRTIGAWAFSGSGLTSVSLPPELTCIDVATFWGCHNLTSVTIPEGVTEIKNNAFRWCGKLTTITLPKSVRTVERETFYECGGLKSVSLRMSSPPVIQNNAFKGCGKLAEIRVPSDSMRWSKFKSAGKTVQGIPIVFGER